MFVCLIEQVLRLACDTLITSWLANIYMIATIVILDNMCTCDSRFNIYNSTTESKSAVVQYNNCNNNNIEECNEAFI